LVGISFFNHCQRVAEEGHFGRVKATGCPVAKLNDWCCESGPNLLSKVLNMAKKKPSLSLEEKERIAAQLLAASEGLISTATAMKYAGMRTPERDETRKKRVYRKAQKIKCIGVDAMSSNPASSASASTPRQLVMESDQLSHSQSVSSLSAPLSNSPSTGTMQGPPTAGQDELRRQLEAACEAKPPPRKHRRSSTQKHIEESEQNTKRKKQATAIKIATQQIAATMELSPSNPNKKSQRQIVQEINEKMNTNVSHKSISRMVREGKIGVSPSKPGPVGSFDKIEYSAMKIAFLSYIKLEQAIGKKQSTIKQLSLRVNALVNHSGKVFRRSDDLAKRLKKDVADEIDAKKPNQQELRRVLWTSYGNLKAWYDQWQHTLIALGFGRLKLTDGTEDKLEEGSVIFFEGQKKRIINLDETDGSLDNTKGKRGGRPPVVFYGKEMSGGATAASKSSYTPTIICGSNAEGEAIPPHFQLKSMAVLESRERFAVDFIGRCKDVWGQFGHDKRVLLPCTFGMNEKAGMNAVELEKYFKNSILPLYPDIEDRPLKRVIAKLDSGPGRMNVQMLAHLRLRGLYVVPGLPNSTGKTQETDQNYGPFKGYYRTNLHALAGERFELKKNINVTDLPFLVFGGSDPETGAELTDAFNKSFSVANCLSAWRKCGAVPLTRAPMEDKGIRHEVVLNEDQSVNSTIDPAGSKLLQLEQANHSACDFLSSIGYDGSRLRMSAPRRGAKKFHVTEPQSKERIDLLRKAKSAGQIFHVTHGEHLNSGDFFRARAIDERKKRADDMLKDKQQRYRSHKIRDQAVEIINNKGEPTKETLKSFTAKEIQKLYEWKLTKRSAKPKEELLMAYLSAPAPKKVPDWSMSEEIELKELLTVDMYAKDTALGVQLKQTAKAITNNIDDLDDESAAELLQVLQNKQLGGSTEGRQSGFI